MSVCQVCSTSGCDPVGTCAGVYVDDPAECPVPECEEPQACIVTCLKPISTSYAPALLPALRARPRGVNKASGTSCARALLRQQRCVTVMPPTEAGHGGAPFKYQATYTSQGTYMPCSVSAATLFSRVRRQACDAATPALLHSIPLYTLCSNTGSNTEFSVNDC